MNKIKEKRRTRRKKPSTKERTEMTRGIKGDGAEEGKLDVKYQIQFEEMESGNNEYRQRRRKPKEQALRI